MWRRQSYSKVNLTCIFVQRYSSLWNMLYQKFTWNLILFFNSISICHHNFMPLLKPWLLLTEVRSMPTTAATSTSDGICGMVSHCIWFHGTVGCWRGSYGLLPPHLPHMHSVSHLQTLTGAGETRVFLVIQWKSKLLLVLSRYD